MWQAQATVFPVELTVYHCIYIRRVYRMNMAKDTDLANPNRRVAWWPKHPVTHMQFVVCTPHVTTTRCAPPGG